MDNFIFLGCILCASILIAAGSAPVGGLCSEADESVLIQSRVAIDAVKQELVMYSSMDEVDKIKATFVDPKVSAVNSSSVTEKKCFDAHAWLQQFAKEPSWQNYSQGDQDAVLSSLFSADHLGTTDKNFVEFGFPDHDFSTSYGNGRNLKENMGFNNFLELDGSGSNPEINKHTRFTTAANIAGIFDHFKVPLEADYISVDIDSCDLWLFHAITEKYRPRVMTVEYNSNYAMDDYTTLRCNDPTAKGAYLWSVDNIYGASLSAIELAAQKRGYSLVYVTPKLDAFLVRSDLLCQGTAVPKARFNATTSLPIHNEYTDKFGPKSQLLTDFKEWLAAHPSGASSVAA